MGITNGDFLVYGLRNEVFFCSFFFCVCLHHLTTTPPIHRREKQYCYSLVFFAILTILFSWLYLISL